MPMPMPGDSKLVTRILTRYRSLAAPAILMVVVLADVLLLLSVAAVEGPGFDARSWWSIDLDDLYGQARTSMVGSGAFRFSPAIAQVFAPLAALPWIVFLLVFLAIQLAAIVGISGRRWPYVVLLPPVLANLYSGNVDILMGAAVVAGFRWPGAWAFLLLTKVTPGIGVLWFAFRQEWRNFGIALASTLLVVAISFFLAPHLCFKWIDALRGMSDLPQLRSIPALGLRLVLAVVLLWYAARRDRRWLLPVVCLLAVPNPWLVTFSVLGASVALWPTRLRAQAGPATMRTR